MTISKELEASILRYHHVEKWRVGTIANQLRIHHSVVKRVLTQAGIPQEEFMSKGSMVTPFLPFIHETLAKYPDLTASCLYGMVRERGYPGQPDHFRHLIALHRPRPIPEAYLRLRTLPGEQAQVDWGHFGHIQIGKSKRPLMAFVMVLSFSRKIMLRFYLNARLSNFLHGHEVAFEAWQGVPRILLYDNLKSAVLERHGEAIRFNPDLLTFSAHYRFEPRPVAIARGNEKGRVERAIRYVRDNFFAARRWEDIDDLNAQAQIWCDEVAAKRPCPEERSSSVEAVFLQEQSHLTALPDTSYPTHEREEVKIGKTPYARFDLNDYSIPYTYVRRTLTVIATQKTVKIVDGSACIAEHIRSYDKGAQIECEAHIKELSAVKMRASKQRGQDRLISAIPLSKTLLIQAAARGYAIGAIISQLLQLLERYGVAELAAAINEALSHGAAHPNAVRLFLEKHREERHQLPPVHLDLPNDKRVRELVVLPHSLQGYDQLHLEKE